MSVMIRLQRVGKKNRPTYRIAVVDKRFKRDGRFIEIVGNYNPLKGTDDNLVIQRDRIEYWVSKGARLSERIETFMRRPVTAAAASGAAPSPAAGAAPAPAPTPKAEKLAPAPKVEKSATPKTEKPKAAAKPSTKKPSK